MKTFGGFSYFLMLVLIFFCIGTRRYALCEEQCSKKPKNRLFDQSFGLELTPDDFLTPMMSMSPWFVHDYFRPWRHLASLNKDLGSTIKTDKDRFEVNLDVQHFSPDEVTVKTDDGYVIIEAKHEEKKDEHGYVSRQFVRRYALPEGTESKDIVSQLSSDGILTVSAPRKEVEGKKRVVPIIKTGPVRKETKDSQEGSCEASGQSCNKV